MSAFEFTTSVNSHQSRWGIVSSTSAWIKKHSLDPPAVKGANGKQVHKNCNNCNNCTLSSKQMATSNITWQSMRVRHRKHSNLTSSETANSMDSTLCVYQPKTLQYEFHMPTVSLVCWFWLYIYICVLPVCSGHCIFKRPTVVSCIFCCYNSSSRHFNTFCWCCVASVLKLPIAFPCHSKSSWPPTPFTKDCQSTSSSKGREGDLFDQKNAGKVLCIVCVCACLFKVCLICNLTVIKLSAFV